MQFGVIGLGSMGQAMCERLLESGIRPVVHNRSPEPMRRLEALGADAAGSIAELAERASVVMTVLPEGKDVVSVFEGDTGLLAHAGPGALLLDCSTVEPALSRKLAVQAHAHQLRFADVGVGGVPAEGRAGRLNFMFGAEATDVTDIEDALRPLAATMWHCGPPGSGMTTKIINNLLATTIHVADLEAVILAERAGLNVSTVLQALYCTLASNRQLRDRIPAELIQTDHQPGFKIDLAYKDAKIGESLATDLAVPLMSLSSGIDLLREARGRGYGALSVSVLLRTLRERVEEFTADTAATKAGIPGA